MLARSISLSNEVLIIRNDPVTEGETARERASEWDRQLRVQHPMPSFPPVRLGWSHPRRNNAVEGVRQETDRSHYIAN